MQEGVNDFCTKKGHSNLLFVGVSICLSLSEQATGVTAMVTLKEQDTD
jgi:hypothetical protein